MANVKKTHCSHKAEIRARKARYEDAIRRMCISDLENDIAEITKNKRAQERDDI